ncbi:MAG: hypothetical protein ACOCWA_03815 [Bacteroidota bacterium]
MKFLVSSVLSLVLLLISCTGNTDTVESGTYIGEIEKVVPEETEIYVKTKDGKTLELYFTEETRLTRDGETVAFFELSKGTTVQVDVEKAGKRLDPLSI